MEPSSPWLDIHRPSGPQPHAPLVGVSDSDEQTVERERKTNPWDDIDTTTRPSQTNVELPNPDQLADD